MKTIQVLMVALALTIVSACGGSTQNPDTHTHTEDCTQSHDSSSDEHMHKQESFTVESDSTQSHESEEAETHHEHKHDDGTSHKH